MRKFITFVPMQHADNLLYEKYEAMDNEKLQMDGKTHFPVIPMINGYVENGEKFSVIAVYEEGNADCKNNTEVMKNEIKSIAEKKGAEFELVAVEISKEENIEEYMKNLTRIVDNIDDGDVVYACITYGTKPTPIVEFTALNLVSKLKNNVMIDCIVYGKINRDKNMAMSACIYDVTALFYLNSIVDSIDRINMSDPIDAIKKILDI